MAGKCNRCGKVVPEKSLHPIQGKSIKVCRECAGEYTCCEQCGNYTVYHDTLTLHSGKTICLWCLYEKYIFCLHCREFIRKEDTVEFHGHLLCKDCMESYFEPCQCCRKLTESDELVYVNTNSSNLKVCPSCLKEHFVNCSVCGSAVEKNSAIFKNSKVYCQYCRELAD